MPFYFAIDIRHRTMNERVPLLLTFSYTLFFLHVFLFHPNFFGECALRATTASTSLPQKEEEKKAFYLSAEFVKTERVWESSSKGARYQLPHLTTSAASTAIFVANTTAAQTKLQCFCHSQTWVQNKNIEAIFCPLFPLGQKQFWNPQSAQKVPTHFSTLPDFFKEGKMSTAPAENGQQKSIR